MADQATDFYMFGDRKELEPLLDALLKCHSMTLAVMEGSTKPAHLHPLAALQREQRTAIMMIQEDLDHPLQFIENRGKK